MPTRRPIARILGIDDFKQCEALCLSRPTVMGVPKTPQFAERWQKILPLYLEGSNSRVMIGSFFGETLSSLLGMYFWREFPYWTLTNLTVAPNTSLNFNAEKNGLAASMNLALEIAESRGCFRYFSCVNAKYWRAFDRKLTQSVSRLKTHYYYTHEEYLPAGTKSQFAAHRLIMGDSEWPIDVVILSRTLRAEYRRFANNV